jgi:hypothetical protein
VTVVLVLLALGLAVFGLVLSVRHLDSLAWRRSLTAFRLHPPAGLTPDQVAS